MGLLCLAAAARGQTTYYVSPDGNDGATGLATTSALRTVQRALNLAQPGDTVLLRGGTYREHAQAVRSGTPGQPITLAAYSNETPVIKGSRVVTNWTHAGGSIWKRSGWTNWSQQVFVDGEPLQMIGPTLHAAYAPIGLGVADMIPGSFHVATNESALYVWLPDGDNPAGHLVEAAAGDYRRVLDLLGYYHVDGLDIRHSNVIVQWPAFFAGDGSVVRNCTIRHNDMIGVIVGHNARLENCDISHNGVLGAQTSHTNVTIRNNLVYSNNYRGFNDNFISAGIKVYGAGTVLVESNLLHDNFGNGIWVDFCRDESLKQIRGNTILRNRRPPSRPDAAAAALFAEISRNVLFENNLVVDSSITAVRIAESDNCRVFNNTIIGTLGHAAIEARLNPRQIPYNQYAENVPANYEWITFTSNRLANNLLYNNEVEYELWWPTNSPNTNLVVHGNASDFNLFHRDTGIPAFRAAGIHTGLVAFSAATGFDVHSLQQTPRLAEPASGNYRLSAISPAVDAGTNLPELVNATDLDGGPRLLFGAMDLGAYEFNGSAEAIAPSVDILTPGGTVSYDVLHVAGINNANAVGAMWAEVAENGGATNSHPVYRVSDTSWRLDDLTLQTGIVYAMTVFATNLNGAVASDSLVVERGGIGTGTPGLAITNTPPLATLAPTFVLGGTNNPHVAGPMRWINRYAGSVTASGTFPRAGTVWSATISGLQTGENRIVISATNAWGVYAAATTVVHHGETPAHYVSTNSPNPAYPYLSWDTAAHVLMDAVDAASDGDRVVVGPGLYDRGGRDDPYGAARLFIDKGITVESSEGPASTVIWGYRPGGPVAMRGVLIRHSNAVFRGFTVSGGTALGIYPLERKHGGGLLAFEVKDISNCVFSGNTALPDGAGGGVMLYDATPATLSDATFVSNRAANGAGCAIWFGKNITASRLTAHGNIAEISGGGFSVDNISGLHSALAYDNIAGAVGGGFSMANNVFLWNCAAEHNTAGQSGGGFYFIASTADVYNVTAWTNVPDALGVASNQLSHRAFNSLFGGSLPTSVVYASILQTDPRYENPAQRDFRLRHDSPAIDAGATNLWLGQRADLDGSVRVAGPAPDLGPYEHWRNVWMTLAAPAYYSGSGSWVNVTMTWASDRSLSNSVLQFALPGGWTVGAYSGAPPATLVSATQLVMTGSMTTSPVQVAVRLDVAAGVSGLQTVTVHHAYQVSGMAAPLTNRPAADLRFDNYKYLHIVPSGSGYVTINDGWYVPGAEVRLTPYANPGWRFRGWLGDTADGITNLNGSLDVVMDRHRDITADFVKLVSLSITSAFAAVTPQPGAFVVDQGTRIDLSALATVTNNGVTYVPAAWHGSGSLPATGTARQISVPILEDSSLTWIWVPLEAAQQTPGYRIRGILTADILVQLAFDPSPDISRAWCRPLLPPGSALLQAGGTPPATVTTNGFLLLDTGLEDGEARFEFTIQLPPDHVGPIEIRSETGLNALPGEVLNL